MKRFWRHALAALSCLLSVFAAPLPNLSSALIAEATADIRKLDIPESGTPSERVRQLWERTRPVILADAKASLSDTEYLTMRPALFDAWVGLQLRLSQEKRGAKAKGAPADKAIVEVLGLIDKVYGIPYYKAEKRLKTRARVTKRIDKHLARLDKRIAALP